MYCAFAPWRPFACIIHCPVRSQPVDKRMQAFVHLACAYSGVENPVGTSDTNDAGVLPPEPIGWCYAREVISYLHGHGAKTATLQKGIEVEWAALNSDRELSSAEDKDSTSPRYRFLHQHPSDLRHSSYPTCISFVLSWLLGYSLLLFNLPCWFALCR
jgi:hypothetical protein